MKEKFRNIRLSKGNKEKLTIINSIIREYQSQGYVLTLRQLYYQLVSRDIIPNNVKEYGKISGILKEGRISGIVDWSSIEDRVRKPECPWYTDSPESAINTILRQYRLDRMEGQDTYVEVWVEKDALSGVLKRVTEKYGINIMVNRGYSSISAMYEAFKRFRDAHDNGQSIKIVYLGDFDPSGLDMIRDIEERIREFIDYRHPEEEMDGHWGEDYYNIDFEVLPIGLNKEQIRKYNPPPNPAKKTDPRSKKFIAEHGASSWEIDALKPEILNKILEDKILDLIDFDVYDSRLNNEQKDKGILKSFIEQLNN